MTNLRRLKKQAASEGMSEREFRLFQVVEDMLEAMRWLQVLGYSNQFLLQQKLHVDAAERDQILAAATRAVDRDAKLHEWRQRLAAIKTEIVNSKRGIHKERKLLAREQPEAGHDR